MRGKRFWRCLGVVAASALVAAPMAVFTAASAGADVTAQSTATVATAQELATQWGFSRTPTSR